jgi:hypothetical protein
MLEAAPQRLRLADVPGAVPHSDIHYKDFVSQPVQTARRIFEFAGCDCTDDDEHAIRAEMQVSIPNKFGKHVYRMEDYF